MSDYIVICEDVHKVYERPRVHALKGVSLRVRRGEFLAIMGPSGSGKSTLLHIIGGLLKPTRGRVIVDGVVVSELPEAELARFRRKKIGFVFQQFYLVEDLTALENVMLPLVPVQPTWLRKRAEELLRLVGLEHRMHHKPTQLSVGEQQRVAIARALINDPPLIVADEPTGNLDSETGRRIIELFRRLSRELGKTVIMATHDERMARLADRIIYLRDGRIVKEETLR